LVLGLAAGTIGAGLAVAAVRVINVMMPPFDFQNVTGAAVSPRALLLVVGLSLVTRLDRPENARWEPGLPKTTHMVRETAVR